jgi:hypothetical protein
VANWRRFAAAFAQWQWPHGDRTESRQKEVASVTYERERPMLAHGG